MFKKRCLSLEYVNKWKIFQKTSLPEKDDFYSNLNMEYITDSSYKRAKRFFKDLINLGECHDFCLKNDTLLLVDVFGREKCD